jgi:uncharacterized protein YabN with tetrapyrrole methylase and pyrophosphatase domain
MKDIFEELVVALRKNRKECPWANDREIEEHVHEVVSEAKEALAAVENGDDENLKEELGDLMMNILFIGVVAEEKKLFTIKEMIEDVKQKLFRRKPWVFGDEKIGSKEDALRRWNEIKEKEKLSEVTNV